MTTQRRDNYSTPFGIWTRQQDEIDSSKGYVSTNLDYIWENYNTGDWLLIEEKRYKAELTAVQEEQFWHLCNCINYTVPAKKCPTKKTQIHPLKHTTRKFHGFHLLQFEITTPDDGRMWLNYEKISREELILFLQFRKHVDDYFAPYRKKEDNKPYKTFFS